MTKIVGIRFRTAGKIYYFDPLDFELETAMHVIVETARGVEMGTVLIPPKEVEDDKVIQPLKPVIRVATDEDEKNVERNKEREKEAFKICKEKIIKHGLEMKLVDAEYTFDNNKLLFYFTADGRIDFRELVKDLAAVFRTRIELRQIGVRDETKMMGGLGICGRELCCKSYLSDFVPVSIKMAKEQNLSLNPTKISGVCGRLMCCLKNEQETYEYLNSRMPNVGDIVVSKDGTKGEVKSLNVLRQYVKVLVENGDEKEMREFSVDDIKFTPGRKKDVKVTAEELKELEGLEDNDEVAEEKPKPRNHGGNQNRNHQKNNGDDTSRNSSRHSNESRDYDKKVCDKRDSDRRDCFRRDNANAVRGNNQRYERKSSDMDKIAGDNQQLGHRPEEADRAGDSRPNDNRQNDNRNHYNKNRRNRYKGKRNDNGNRNTNRQQSDTQ